MADVNVLRKTGAATAVTNTEITTTTTQLAADDAHVTGGTTNPVKIPSAGNNYSYWGTMKMEVSANTANHTVNNMQWYASGSLGTGLTANVAAASAYVQATGTVGETGAQLTSANYASISTGPSAIASYTSASTLAITASQTGTTATGEIGDCVVNQVDVASGAAIGTSPNITAHFQYDEA